MIKTYLMRTIRLIWRRKRQPTLVFLPGKSMDGGVWQATVHGFIESEMIEHKYTHKHTHDSFQFSSVTQSCPTLWDPMNCSMPGLPVHHQLPGFTQTHVHRVGDAIQPSHPLASPSPPALSPSQHQSLFQ